MHAALTRSDWRSSSRILVPVILAVTITVMIVAAMVLYATHEADALATEREHRLLGQGLVEEVARITRDQQSVTLWDETVKRARRADLDWFDDNIGIWLYDYYRFDASAVLDPAGEPIYVSRRDERLSPSAFAPTAESIRFLVQRLKSRLRTLDPGRRPAPETLQATGLLSVENRPAYVSIVPILSDTGEVAQPPGTEFLHVVVRFLDGSFLDTLSKKYLIDGLRFERAPAVRGQGASYALRTYTGASMGYLRWRPAAPGWLLVGRSAPAFALAFLVVAGIIAWLVGRLSHTLKELQASEAHAQHLAFHDPLTGLPNRGFFAGRLDQALWEARDKGATLALLYLDLDRFKNVNDTLGHPAGDDLICALAKRLSRIVRDTDFVARLGGDEFAIIQEAVTSEADVKALCERIIEAVAAPFQLIDSSAFVGVSIGVAMARGGLAERAEVVRKADIALYRAKLGGRNRYCLFSDDMDRLIQERRTIEAELRETVAAARLDLVYQPIYASETLTLRGAEALLRWQHPTQGSISPAAFIPIAEEAGLIHSIGEWVLREACTKAADWPDARIAVNVSPVQFRAAGFADKVLDILAQAGLEPSRLELEVTESLLLDSAEAAATIFARLRAAGVRIALDDFGTGYSSLSYLSNFPVDKIKIDRSFIQHIGTGAGSEAIVRAMVNLAKAMRVEVTAEGVETEEQRDFLRGIGCDEMQGYLLSRPLAGERLDRIFRGKRRPRVAMSAA